MGIAHPKIEHAGKAGEHDHCESQVISIQLTPEDLVKMRFAYSPLLEMAKSYHRLANAKGKSYGLYWRWMEEAERNLYGIELPYLNAMMSSPSYIPDFLTPPPLASISTIEDELERIQNLPAELIHRNVHTLIEFGSDSDILQQFLAYPYEALYCLLEEMRLYWKLALARHWRRMVSVVEGDMLYRGRQLALEGSGALFNGLFPKANVQVHPLGLEFIPRTHNLVRQYTLNGQGLQLVPSLFSGWISWQIEPDWQPMLIYSPRGTGLWWQSPPPAADQSLEIALGEGRARVLRLLSTPAHTGEIAQRLHITSGAASQHLSRLNQAGLVEPHRSGRRVYYHLTQRGEQLLALFA